MRLGAVAPWWLLTLGKPLGAQPPPPGSQGLTPPSPRCPAPRSADSAALATSLYPATMATTLCSPEHHGNRIPLQGAVATTFYPQHREPPRSATWNRPCQTATFH